MMRTSWALLSMALASASEASAMTLSSFVRDGIVGTIAPQGWISLVLAYCLSIMLWGILSTVLVKQLAIRIRSSTAIPAVLAVATSFGLYVLAWGIPSTWEWLWAIALNLWQGAASVRHIHKQCRAIENAFADVLAPRSPSDFVSEAGIRDVLRLPTSPMREQFFGKEFFFFHDPGTPPMINPKWSADAKAEFSRDTKLAMVFGGPNQVIFRSAQLEQILLKKGGQIRVWSDLLQAYKQCGYRTKHMA